MNLIFDLGYSKLRLATVVDNRRQPANFSEPKIIDTPAKDEEIVAALKNFVPEPKAVVGGVTRKRLAAATAIKNVFTCPVELLNDAALVGLGEAVMGAGVGSRILAYLTISSGVGGARIVDGQIDPYVEGFEPGHQIIDFKRPEKHFEDYISGLAVLQTTGKEPKTITDPAFWSDLAKLAAVGIHNTIMHWSPDRVILGGSMIKTPGLALAEIQTELLKISRPFSALPELKLAALGDLGGLHGALAYLRSERVRS